MAEGRFSCMFRGGGGVGNKTKGERDLGRFLVWEERGTPKDGDAENERVSRCLMCSVQGELGRDTRLVMVGVSSGDSETDNVSIYRQQNKQDSM